MKIIYVKNNSERAKAFQLKTIIYEENGQKYIKKQALTKEAIPHLKKMKETYTNLSNDIIDTHIKIAKILNESEDSLTFEFIEGESLESKFSKASQKEKDVLLHQYITLVKDGFKTTNYQASFQTDPYYKALFGEDDFALFEEESHFDTVSNMDLIFSNIIYSGNDIYLIDYEWAYGISLPTNYILYRTLSMLSDEYTNTHIPSKCRFLFRKMERHFIDKFVMNDGFYFQKFDYIKTNTKIMNFIKDKEDHIKELEYSIEMKENHIKELVQHRHGLDEHIEELAIRIHNDGENLAHAHAVIELRDAQIGFLNQLIQNLRLKGRLKNLIPSSILSILGKEKPLLVDMKDCPSELRRIQHYSQKQAQLTDEISHELQHFEKQPLISIIMPVYNVDPRWLELAIKSVEHQWYTNWELCIADDKSTHIETINYLKNLKNPKIKITFLEKNMNISGASNAALDLASGEYIALLDNDDELTLNALYEMVKVINEKDADFIYSDEDFISPEGICANPHYKPDFSPDLLLSHNYITHFSCFKKSLLDSVGRFNAKFDGAQDYDLFLRMTEKTQNIYHITKILYHWRTIEGSTSADAEAKPEAIERGRVALEEALQRRGIKGTVEHANLYHYFRVRYAIEGNPLISIVIPFKDKPELLDMCIHSILEKSSYQNYEIIGISNNSEENTTFEMMATLEKEDPRVKFYEYNTEFNYSDINNHAVNNYAKGEHVLLLNNDIEVISTDWLESMLEHSQRKDVGCVGAKLYYPNDTIQHAGVIIGLGGYAGHSHKMHTRESFGYYNRLCIIQNLSAVTAACLMIKTSLYKKVGGLDAKNFKVAFNDVDFCLRIREDGYLNIFTPYTEAYHHESISRGYENTAEKVARFQTEKDALYARHSELLTGGDPYYNPNLCDDKEDFSICPK
jgi:GT2 family glycosyltransferase